jgi:hypothetical protein
VADPLDPVGYEARCKASDWPGKTLRVFKEKEQGRFGEYRTRRLVQEAWGWLGGSGEWGERNCCSGGCVFSCISSAEQINSGH